jgi:hypothetical protein
VLITRNTTTDNTSPNYTYIVLTNNHVLKSPNKEFYIETPDGRIHTGFLHPKNENFAGHDLGMLWFNSPYFYDTAILAKSSNLRDKEQTFIAGFPCDLTSVTMECPGTFQFLRGEGKKLDKPLKDGYQLAYTNESRVGMSGGPVFNNQGNVIGINGRGKDDSNSAQYKYANGSGTPQSIIGKSLALGLPIEIYLNLFPKTDKIFAGINTKKNFKLYTLNIDNSDKQNQINNQSDQSQSSQNNSNLQLIILVAVFIILIINGLFWFLHYEDLKELKKLKLVIQLSEDLKNIQEHLKSLTQTYQNLDNTNKDFQENIKKLDKRLNSLIYKLNDNRIIPVNIALLVIQEDKCFLLDLLKKGNQNCSHSINMKTNSLEVIEIQYDVIMVSKKISVNSIMDCKIIKDTDNYQLEPITDETIKKQENYDQAWVLTRINNNSKLVEIEVSVPSQ